MGRAFLDLVSLEEARARLKVFKPRVLSMSLPLQKALGHVLSEEVRAPENLPAFSRSLMDGYAVFSRDLAGARETAPILLQLVGLVEMGEPPQKSVSPGKAIAIPTGGMLPEGADAVLMVEHSRPVGQSAIEATRALAPGENVLRAGDDLKKGATILHTGKRLATLDLGACLATGVQNLPVFSKPRVAILSTGDELVPPNETPGPAQVRDTNAMTLAAQVMAAGGSAQVMPRVGDQANALRKATENAAEQADMILLSGGSSVGARDHTADILRQLSGDALILEGIAISPGKPTLLSDLGGKPVFGMPGHPISSFVVFHVLVAPLLRRLGGEEPLAPPRRIRARLAENLESSPGRESWQRVSLRRSQGGWLAQPIPGGSAVYRSLAFSDGLVCLPAGLEGKAAGDEVNVEVLR